MSADNYALCPQCRANAARGRTGFRREIALRSLEETLREDYEWWIDERDGVIHGLYKCHCPRCGFAHAAEIEKPTMETGGISHTFTRGGRTYRVLGRRDG